MFSDFFNGENFLGRIQSKSLKQKDIKVKVYRIISKHGITAKTKSFLSMNSDLGPPDEITQEKILFEINLQNTKMLYEPYKDLFASGKYYIKLITISFVKNIKII